MHFLYKIFIFSLCLFYIRALRTSFQSSLGLETTSTTSTTSEQQWTAVEFLNDAPDQRRGHSSIVMGTQLWIFGGCYLDQKCFNDLHSFDTQTKTWTTLKVNGIPPSAREGHTATVVGSKMYLFGGSGSSAYYNDLYTLDLETQTWTQLTLKGTKPAARANHGAIVDLKGRIIIFGGFTENGYANDVYIIDPVEELWGKPFISGTAPVARESFSMTRVRNAVWIYGGFTDGGVLSDLVILDLDSMAWNTVETSGTQPSGRQGHGAILQENNLIIFGGCNYKINTCYSDTYNLDIDSLWWSKVADANTQALTGREDFSANVMGADIYVFGGCLLYESCYNDMIVYDTGVACPNDCNDNGVCRNDRCVCLQGYYDNDCSLAITCTDNCNDHGQCRTNGKCACYASYTGESCEIFVSCPLNCTDEAHGLCQSSGECQCNPGFSGDGCQDGTALVLTCPNDCSGHGTCDTTKGICVCDTNYSGDDCSQTAAAAVVTPQEEEKEQEPEEPEETTPTKETTKEEPEEKEEPESEVAQEEPAAEESEEEIKPVSQPLETSKQVSSKTPATTTTTTPTTVTTLTPQMFGEPSVSEQKLQKQNEIAALVAEANNCPNSCSYIGLCRNNVCYCTNGYTGEDCSEANIDNLGKGESIEKTMEYAGAFFILGSIIGVFVVFTLVSKANIADYMDIEERKEEND